MRVLLYDLTEELTVGATFRQGPKFHYLADSTTGEGNLGPANVSFVEDLEGPFKVPDTWAIGLAFRPTNAWRIGFEYDKVMYSQLIEQITNTAHAPSDPEGMMIVDRLTLGDSDQFRIGGEYSTSMHGWLYSFRAGAWYDPLHRPYLHHFAPAPVRPAAPSVSAARQHRDRVARAGLVALVSEA